MAENFSTTGVGTPLDMSLSPQNQYSMQIVVPSGVPVAWSVVLEISLDGTNWVTILTHTSVANGIATIVFFTGNPAPASWMRFRVPTLLLGTSPNITAYALAMD